MMLAASLILRLRRAAACRDGRLWGSALRCCVLVLVLVHMLILLI